MILHPDTCEVTYAVFEVDHYIEDQAVVFSFEHWEYKTLKHAERRMDLMAGQGRTALLQVGVTRWLNPDDASEVIEAMSKQGVHWR